MTLKGLIVSCQPVPGGPQDNAVSVVGYAKAALASGATALRIESVAYVAAVRAATNMPIIGLVKRDLLGSPVRITPYVADVEALADAGADIIAFDATDRLRPASLNELVCAVKARKRLAMADCACLDDARKAIDAGADFVGTTLSGYTGGPEPVEPDIALITEMSKLTPHVIAEGRIRSPRQAADAIRAGARAVVVGSAITRTEHVTSWFRAAVQDVIAHPNDEPVLAIDIGGTKTMAALVSGTDVLEELTVPTDRNTGPDGWLAAIVNGTRSWNDRFRHIGIAATGLIRDGVWSALNSATLAVPQNYPLVKNVQEVFGFPAHAVNDAQAAAWGECRFGAGDCRDTVFLTISTGIGGGIVLNGRLRQGLAGHFGLIRGRSKGEAHFEDTVSGRWIATQAGEAGHHVAAPEVFARWRDGEEWATKIVTQSAKNIALLCEDIQAMIDPQVTVIGGGIGLSEGFHEAVASHLSQRFTPKIVKAKLGRHAGVIGVADLATTHFRAKSF